MFEVCRRVLAFGLAVWPLFLRAQSPSAVENAVIVEMENVVEMQARGTPWKRAQVGVPLAIGDRLRRARDKAVVLNLERRGNRTVVAITPD